MKNVKVSTIIRVVALVAVLTNQVLAIFGKNLPFTDSVIYQVISVILTIAVAGYSAWKNNDFTKFARAAGSVFDALKDGKITTDEVESIVKNFSDTDTDSEDTTDDKNNNAT